MNAKKRILRTDDIFFSSWFSMFHSEFYAMANIKQDGWLTRSIKRNEKVQLLFVFELFKMAAMTSASPVQLQLQTVFGVRSKLESSLFFADEQTVIYPAGNQFILGNVETKGQRIFRCPELEHIDWLLVHNNAALIAVVATGLNPEKQNTTTISFYDLFTTVGKRKRMFELRDTPMTIVSMAFSHDARHLAILECGNREYTLSLWLWQRSRLLASIKLGAAESVTVLSQILFHPTDHNLLSVIGRRYARFIRHLDGNLRIQPTAAKLDQCDFISHGTESKFSRTLPF